MHCSIEYERKAVCTKELEDVHDVPNGNDQSYNNLKMPIKYGNNYFADEERNWGSYKLDDGVNKCQSRTTVMS